VAQAMSENGLNIEVITRLSGRVSLIKPETSPKACIQMSVSGRLADPDGLRGRLLAISEQTGVDISFHVDNLYAQNRRLVVFDMDSTLVQAEVINILAKRAGAGERVAQMEQDMATLKGKLAEAKTRLKGMQSGHGPRQGKNGAGASTAEQGSPGERKVRRALERFDRLQAQVDNLEARVRSYEVGGPAARVWNDPAAEATDPAIEAELERLKERVAATARNEASAASDAAQAQV